MKTVVVGFSRAKSKFALFSQLIMSFEQSKFSHCYVRFNSCGVDLVYQASKNLVNLFSFKIFSAHNDTIHQFKFEVSDAQYEQLVQFAFKSLGTRYSWTQVCLIALSRLFPSLLTYQNGPTQMVCSELAARCSEYIGVEFTGNPDMVTPRQLFEFLDNHRGQDEVF